MSNSQATVSVNVKYTLSPALVSQYRLAVMPMIAGQHQLRHFLQNTMTPISMVVWFWLFFPLKMVITDPSYDLPSWTTAERGRYAGAPGYTGSPKATVCGASLFLGSADGSMADQHVETCWNVKNNIVEAKPYWHRWIWGMYMMV